MTSQSDCDITVGFKSTLAKHKSGTVADSSHTPHCWKLHAWRTQRRSSGSATWKIVRERHPRPRHPLGLPSVVALLDRIPAVQDLQSAWLLLLFCAVSRATDLSRFRPSLTSLLANVMPTSGSVWLPFLAKRLAKVGLFPPGQQRDHPRHLNTHKKT